MKLRSTRRASISSTSRVFSPASLFVSGEVGAWYDPSDLTTLFQDTTGITPVTTPGQTVALMLDKSRLGNHATQATANRRPTYGIVPFGKTNSLRNTISVAFTENFGDAWWLKYNGVTVTNNAAASPIIGDMTADLITFSAINQQVGRAEGSNDTSMGWYNTGNVFTFSVYMRAVSGTSTVVINLGNGGAGGSYTENTVTLTTAWQRVSVTHTFTNSNYGGANILNKTNINGVYVWGAQLESGSAVTTYQRYTNQYNVVEPGTLSSSYLFFDGVDDCMVTGTITPGSVDKVQVFAGMRKLSDATLGMIVEYSAAVDTNNGTFFLAGSRSGGGAPNYGFRNKGTVLQDADGTGYAAPITNVLGALGDISGDRATLRVNATQVTQTTGDQGTGNFLSYPLYIGCRGGTALPYNGNIYSLITRFSAANLDTATIASTEKWVNSKTGAY